MMHKVLGLFLFLLSVTLSAQVGIGTTNPQASLDIFTVDPTNPSDRDGILIPRVDEFPITNPGVNQDGMLLFITGNGSIEKGLYYWDNNIPNWVSFLTASAERIDDLLDGKSEISGSSLFLGMEAGENDDENNNRNTGVGFQALTSNSVSPENTALGHRALSSLQSGVGGNTAIGERALESTTVGRHNVAIGYRAMANTGPDARRSVAIGYQAMSETNGGAGTAVGIESMRFTTSGEENAAFGNRSMYLNTTGSRNTGIGYQALFNNTTASRNTALGYQALATNTTGQHNSVIGYQALVLNETGQENVAIGYHAARNITGSRNVIIGMEAGRGFEDDLSAIDGNVFIGNRAGYFETNSDRLYIENSDADFDNALIYGEFDSNLLRFNGTVGIGRNPLTNALEVNGEASKTTAGGFVANSDRRLKKNIQTIEGKTALDLITQMNGVTYEWNDEVTGNKRPDGKQYGFIAQELKILFPEKVSLDAQGFYQTAYGDYDALFVQALKELKKENEVLKNKIEKLLQLEERIAMLEKEGIN